LTSTRPTRSSAKPPDGQVERFIEAARQLGCDEDEKAFEEKLKKIAGHKPKPRSTKRDK
jgi:hypothetical protein